MSTQASPSRISRTSYVACPAAWRRSSAMQDSFRREAYERELRAGIPRLGGFGGCLAIAEEFAPNSLDDPRHRNRSERTKNPGELGPNQHGNEHDQWCELHRAAVDDRLEDVVLQLLVDDEEHDDDHALDPPDLDEDDGRDEDGERDRVIAAQAEEDDGACDSCDDADEDVPCHVASDRAVDLRTDAPPPGAAPVREESVKALDQSPAVEEHEKG